MDLRNLDPEQHAAVSWHKFDKAHSLDEAICINTPTPRFSLIFNIQLRTWLIWGGVDDKGASGRFCSHLINQLSSFLLAEAELLAKLFYFEVKCSTRGKWWIILHWNLRRKQVQLLRTDLGYHTWFFSLSFSVLLFCLPKSKGSTCFHPKLFQELSVNQKLQYSSILKSEDRNPELIGSVLFGFVLVGRIKWSQ